MLTFLASVIFINKYYLPVSPKPGAVPACLKCALLIKRKIYLQGIFQKNKLIFLGNIYELLGEKWLNE